LKVAKQYKDKINFAISAKDDFQYELNEYGIDFVKDDKPIVLARDAKNLKYTLREPFS
jgi:protein disulfide isomerase family A protein 3